MTEPSVLEHVGLPSTVAEYESLKKNMKAMASRLAEITPIVTSWADSLPAKSYDVGDGKIRITEVITYTPVTRSFVMNALVKLLKLQSSAGDVDDARCHLVACEIVNFIWKQRTVTRIPRLQRTWSIKRRRSGSETILSDILVDARREL